MKPILEYACAVWNPYLVKDIYAIESVQRRASRLICGSGKEYTERLGELKWDSLELRRKYLSHCDVDASKFYDMIGPLRTLRNHDFKLRPQPFRSNYVCSFTEMKAETVCARAQTDFLRSSGPQSVKEIAKFLKKT